MLVRLKVWYVVLLRDQIVVLLSAIATVLFIARNAFRHLEHEKYGLPVEEELDEEDFVRVVFLHIDQFVSVDVPVLGRLLHSLLIDHLALDAPDLEQKWLVLVLFQELGINDFDKHRAEFGILLVLATCDDFVELVERHLIHDLAHVLFCTGELVVLESIIFVLFQYFSQQVGFICFRGLFYIRRLVIFIYVSNQFVFLANFSLS